MGEDTQHIWNEIHAWGLLVREEEGAVEGKEGQQAGKLDWDGSGRFLELEAKERESSRERGEVEETCDRIGKKKE